MSKANDKDERAIHRQLVLRLMQAELEAANRTTDRDAPERISVMTLFGDIANYYGDPEPSGWIATIGEDYTIMGAYPISHEFSGVVSRFYWVRYLESFVLPVDANDSAATEFMGDSFLRVNREWLIERLSPEEIENLAQQLDAISPGVISENDDTSDEPPENPFDRDHEIQPQSTI